MDDPFMPTKEEWASRGGYTPDMSCVDADGTITMVLTIFTPSPTPNEVGRRWLWDGTLWYGWVLDRKVDMTGLDWHTSVRHRPAEV